MTTHEVLSQNQIDSILSAIDQGSTSVQHMKEVVPQTKDVRGYDFRYPSKFSREHVQSFQAIHELYARLLSTQLTTQMRLPVQSEVISLDRLTYDEFMRSIPNPTVVLLYRLNPLKGNVLFEFTPGTAIALIERLLGGPGRSLAKPRELTDIEQTLITTVMNKGMLSLQEAWKNILPDLKAVHQTLETNPRFVQISAPSDSVLVVSFEIRLGDTTGSMRLCLPYPTVEELLPRLSRQYVLNQGGSSPQEGYTPEVKQHVEQVSLRMALELGCTHMSLQEWMGLEVGDVVRLDTGVEDPLCLRVEHSPKFWAKPGTVNHKMAAQITDIIDEGHAL